MESGSVGENGGVPSPRPTPARTAIVTQLVASGRLSAAVASELVKDGRVDDTAWARVRPLHEEEQRQRLERETREVEAARPRTEDEALRRIDEAIASLLNASDTYWAAVAIASAASDGLMHSGLACDHYAIWSELTDWYELKPDERSAAVAAMQRAAAEWLTAKDDDAQRTYFQRWLPDDQNPA